MISLPRFVRSVSVSALVALAIAVVAALGGCTTNPTTGKRQLNLMSREEEIQTGASAMPELTKEYGGKVANVDLQNYVTSLGRRLADQTEADNPSLPWEFTLLDSDVINAFALPGGKVFVSRGLAEKMTNEAELAAVVGHEIGHVTARHTMDRMSQQTGVGVVAAVAGAIVGAATDNELIRAGAPVAFSVGSQVVVLKFSREQELEADTLGMRYMTKLNYDPKGAQQVMELLQREAGSGGGALNTLFSTHPDPAARVEAIRKKLSKEYAYTQSNPQYQLREEPFRQQFLSKIPPRVPAGKPVKKAEADGARVFDLSGRDTWCAVCGARQTVQVAHRGVLAGADVGGSLRLNP